MTSKENSAAERGRNRMLLLMFLVPLFWGGAFGVGKHVVSELPPFTTATIRFGLAGLLLVLICWYRRAWDWQVMRKRWFGLLIVSLTGIFGYNACFFVGLQYTSATNGALEIAMTPVTITLLSVFILGEKWSGRLGLGMLLSFAGVLTVITHGSWGALLATSFHVGDLWMLGAVLTWSVYSVVGKVVMNDVSPLLSTTVTTIVGTVFLGIGSLFESGWHHVPELSGQAMVEIVYMACFASVAAFLLWNMGVHKIGATMAGAYENIIPFHAAWIAALFYGEQLQWAQAAGMVLILAGVVVTSKAQGKAEAKKMATPPRDLQT